MVVMPDEFVATRYPGYFWNTDDQKLYSIKVTGELRPLAFQKGFVYYGRQIEPGYQISVRGQKRTMTLAYLKTLKKTTKREVIGVDTCLAI